MKSMTPWMLVKLGYDMSHMSHILQHHCVLAALDLQDLFMSQP